MAWLAVPCCKGEPDPIHVAQSVLARQCGLRRVLRKAKDRDVLSEGLAFYDYRAVHRRA